MQRTDDLDPVANPYAATLASAIEAPLFDDDGFATSEFRPFQTIWTQPRRTIRQIVAANPRLHVVLLAALAGMGHFLDSASSRSLGDLYPLATIIVAACLLGPLLGVVGLWVISFAFQLAGKPLGGTATWAQLNAAAAWAAVPAVCALPLWAIQILLLGSDMFTAETPRLDAQPLLFIPILATAMAELVLGVWSFVILCHTLAEVQGFRSAWRGLGNIVVGGVVVMGLMLAVVFCLFIVLMSIPR